MSDSVKPPLFEMKMFADNSGDYLSEPILPQYANWFAEQEGFTKRFSRADQCTPFIIQWYKEMMVKYYDLEKQEN